MVDLSPIVIDYETAIVLPDGSTQASTEFYRHDFVVLSCAFSELGNDLKFHSWFVSGEMAVRQELLKIGKRPVIVHNAQFEIGVTKCRFPDIELNWYCDTMRLVQNYDNGGGEDAFERLILDPTEEDLEDPEYEPKEKINYVGGFGLVNAAKRILDKPNHKLEAHQWLIDNVPGVKKKNAGQFLDRLPPDILERYNIADTETTYELYKFLTGFYDSICFDWRFDHGLYLSTVYQLIESKIRGVSVDREQAIVNAEKVILEIKEIEDQFKQHFAKEIVVIEQMRLEAALKKRKSDKGREKYKVRLEQDPELYRKDVAFNVGSNAQLQTLFVDVLKMQAKFFTKKGSPAFKSSMLHQWGEGGLMLGKRRKRLLVLKQLCNIIKLAEFDGRWHLDLKAVGTATSRLSGGKQG